MDAAPELSSPRVPSGNRLEALTGDRLGLHSARVSDQRRICFRWHDGNAHGVEIVDCH
jgi:toxin HigB-1